MHTECVSACSPQPLPTLLLVQGVSFASRLCSSFPTTSSFYRLRLHLMAPLSSILLRSHREKAAGEIVREKPPVSRRASQEAVCKLLNKENTPRASSDLLVSLWPPANCRASGTRLLRRASAASGWLKPRGQGRQGWDPPVTRAWKATSQPQRLSHLSRRLNISRLAAASSPGHREKQGDGGARLPPENTTTTNTKREGLQTEKHRSGSQFDLR